MDTKNPKTEDLLAFAELLRVKVRSSDLLFDGKTAGYQNRFSKWAKNTYQADNNTAGEHLNNLTDAILSSVAYVIATGDGDKALKDKSVDYLRGVAQGVLIVQAYIKQFASESDNSNNEEIEDLFNN